MKKQIILIIMTLYLIGVGSLAYAGDYAYVLRFNGNEKPRLVQFDVDKDEIRSEIEFEDHDAFNNMVIDEKGGCYISKYRYSDLYGRELYYYDAEGKRISKYMDLKGIFGPRYLALNEKDLIVEYRGSDDNRRTGGVFFVDRKTKKVVKKIPLKEPGDPAYSQADTSNIYYGGSKFLFVTSWYVCNEPYYPNTYLYNKNYYGDLFVIDVEEKKIVKVIEVPREYTYVDGLVNVGDKIYVTAMGKGFYKGTNDSIPNPDLLVFSLESGKLIKTIAITPHARDITYDRSVNKLYVLHMNDYVPRSTVEIISTINDEVIGSLEVESQLMFSVVKPGKVYMTQGPSLLKPVKTPPRLLVLDTKTDKIIKTFDGYYQGISVNPKYW
jgi:DNA-binding beta-propeller fold protein YncE